MSFNPFKKQRSKIEGVSSFMDPAVGLIKSLNDIGGFAYVLFGSGLVLTLFLVGSGAEIVAKIIDWALPLAIALIVVGAVLVIIWQLLEYHASMLKLKMIISITEKMVDKKLQAETTIDSVVMDKITQDILKNVWGLEIKLMPESLANKSSVT